MLPCWSVFSALSWLALPAAERLSPQAQASRPHALRAGALLGPRAERPEGTNYKNESKPLRGSAWGRRICTVSRPFERGLLEPTPSFASALLDHS